MCLFNFSFLFHLSEIHSKIVQLFSYVIGSFVSMCKHWLIIRCFYALFFSTLSQNDKINVILLQSMNFKLKSQIYARNIEQKFFRQLHKSITVVSSDEHVQKFICNETLHKNVNRTNSHTFILRRKIYFIEFQNPKKFGSFIWTGCITSI